MAEVYARFANQRSCLAATPETLDRYANVVKNQGRVIPNLKSLKKAITERQKIENSAQTPSYSTPKASKESGSRQAETRGHPRPRPVRIIRLHETQIDQNAPNQRDPARVCVQPIQNSRQNDLSVDSILEEISRMKARKTVGDPGPMFEIKEEEVECDGDA